ncbi:MAG: hypothetical protein ABI308_16565 [Mucilaginibacter sp.]
MKNFKHIALGLLAGALAIGFSAFTAAPHNGIKMIKKANGQLASSASYFRLPAFASTSPDNDPSHYAFSNSGNCNVNSNICSSTWTTDNPPVNKGDSPADLGNPERDSDSGNGTYDGN